MAGNAYGFQGPQTPQPITPDAVGQLLLQRQQQAQAMPQGMPMDGDADDAAIPTMAASSDWPSADESALRAAILRMPGTPSPSNAKPPAPYSREQMRRFGMRDQEIDLLSASGGANA